MKTAVYIEEGVTQLVLTPENDWERDIVKRIAVGKTDFALRRGGFYECRGGWMTQAREESSLIIVAGIKADPSIPAI